jgi:hypothetical protein
VKDTDDLPGYPVGLVGESHYQPAIRRCRIGEGVQIVPEPANPYDPRALAVISARGQLIGYIPKSSFVQRLVHDEVRTLATHIHAINSHPNGHTGIVILVTAV